MKFLILKIFFWFVTFKTISSDESACISQNTCEECLAADFSCAWCISEDYDQNRPRCMPKKYFLSNDIPKESILTNNELNIVEKQDNDFQDYIEGAAETIQIKPQKLKIKLTKGRTGEIKMTYRPAKNNPLDLYYLMDLTFTMKDDKQTLASVGKELAEALGELTENYRFGYGSFSDKPIWPLIEPGSENNPCITVHDVCEPAYDFRHHLSMTNNAEDFIAKVNASKITGNLDNLEGGMDALMQVIVCNDKVGWSQNARKIVILATDGLMHFAGDGLLEGIVLKNDRTCHLDDSGNYEAALKFDYPSLEEIYRELLNRKVNVIFAVTENVAPTYREISKLMSEISSVEILSEDSSNILQLVEKGYKNFARKVNFVDNRPEFIDITYTTNCGVTDAQKTERQSCNDIDIGEEVEFNIAFTVNDFPQDGNYTQIIKIEETGISEYLEVEIEIQKPCPCEQIEKSDKSSTLCSNHGYFSCGMCKCDEGWIGKSCSCNSHNASSVALQAQCVPPPQNNNPSFICSDFGECECGQCICLYGRTGKYCECEACLKCENLKNWECTCKGCVCKSGWSGDQCDCTSSTETCTSPMNKVCSDQGTCKCGKCECSAEFSGEFCEIESGMFNRMCDYFEPCVKALINERINKNSESEIAEHCLDRNNLSYVYEFKDEITVDGYKCVSRIEMKDGTPCDYQFVYSMDNQYRGQLQIENDPCAPTDYAKPILIGFLVPLLIGILTFIFVKVFMVIKDRRECAEFEKQAKAATYETMSPLYERPIRECRMPELDGDEFN